MSHAAPAARIAVAGTLALALLEVLWETLLAPIAPGVGWLALKALPLWLLLPGVAYGRVRPRQILALLLPWYLAEALVRALNEHGRHALVAGVAALIAATAFVALMAWFRGERAKHRP